MNTSIFTYQDTNITFKDADGNVMVNATEMAKAFGKRPSEWFALNYAVEYLQELSNVSETDISKLYFTKQGSSSNGGGTWVHEDVALEFARWLSPSFSIWCNKRIKELLTHGITATDATIEKLVTDPDFVISALMKLKEEKAIRERTEIQLNLANTTITAQAPKVKYCEEVLSSTSYYRSTQIAKELGFTSAQALNKKLKERGIMYKVNKQWVLTSKYSTFGYTKTLTHTFKDTSDRQRSENSTVWTEKGRLWLHEKFNIKLINTG